MLDSRLPTRLTSAFPPEVEVERIGLAQAAAGVEVVVPDVAGGCTLFKKQHHGFDTGTEEGATGAVEDGMQLTASQQFLAQCFGCLVGIGQESVFNHHRCTATGFEVFDEMLQEQVSRLSCGYGKILLDFCSFFSSKWRVG